MRTLLAGLILVAKVATAQTPVAIWSFSHPSSISGIAVDSNYVATSCYDGKLRIFNTNGANVLTSASSGYPRYCVALRGDMIVGGSTNDFAIAIAPYGTVVDGSHFTTASRVWGITKSGQAAVADDLLLYTHFRSWQYTGRPNDWFYGRGSIAEEPEGGLWTAGPDGHLRRWSNDGNLLFAVPILTFPYTNGLIAVDANLDRVVVSDSNRSIWVLNRATGLITSKGIETHLINAVKFLPDGRIVYGTHDGRLVCWDGATLYYAPVTTPPVTTKPGKGRRK